LHIFGHDAAPSIAECRSKPALRPTLTRSPHRRLLPQSHNAKPPVGRSICR
jgi:hypothetical protein